MLSIDMSTDVFTLQKEFMIINEQLRSYFKL